MASTINASNSGSGGIVQTADASGVLQLQSAGTTAVTIDTSQNVGIGTSSPVSRLDVTRTGATAGITAHFTNGDNDAYIYNTNASICKFTGDTSGNYAWGISSYNAYVAAYTNATERMRIDSSGNLLVGKTSAGSFTTQGLELNPARTDSNFAVTSTSGSNYDMVRFTRTGTSGAIMVGIYYNSSRIGDISISGGTSTSYNTSSDYRLKENIAPMTGALNKVIALKPCTYKWKVDGSDGEGFIAHELAEVCPNAVTGEKDAVDEDGKPIHQGIDTSFLVATLTAAIQELSAKNDALTARVVALESKVGV